MTTDLTTGKIMPILVNFTVPLVLGNLFQLTYNVVDSIIVGHFVGKEALAAVGICNPISTLMILFLNGLCMGACPRKVRQGFITRVSVWIANTCFAYDELVEYIGTENQLVGAVALGVPDEEPASRPRKQLEDVLEYR